MRPRRLFCADLSCGYSGAYCEGGGVVFSGFEGEGEGVLAGRDEAAAEVEEHLVEACDLAFAGVADDFF